MTPILALLYLSAAPAAPTDLSRVFEKGEKLGYQVLSHVTAENRVQHLDTWMPSDLDLNYNFTASVTDMRPDGIAVMHYQRPTMTAIQGETVDAGPKSKTVDIDLDYILSVSPINQILEQKDISKHPNHDVDLSFGYVSPEPESQAQQFFMPFISDIHRLALFVGGVDSALDFAPKLPLGPVKTGGTWKSTVGFEPQKLKSKDGKLAVQRLDYTYTYLGPMEVDGKKILRIVGKLNFSTDLAEYFKQVLEDHASETNVQKVPLQFASTIDFDLDPVTKDTLRADGHTEGGYQVLLTDSSDPITQERFKGRTSLELVGKRVVGSRSVSTRPRR